MAVPFGFKLWSKAPFSFSASADGDTLVTSDRTMPCKPFGKILQRTQAYLLQAYKTSLGMSA
jgi:hypothetical protein